MAPAKCRCFLARVDASHYAEYGQLLLIAIERFDIVVSNRGDTSVTGPIVGLIANGQLRGTIYEKRCPARCWAPQFKRHKPYSEVS
jgi:hypothetical protein